MPFITEEISSTIGDYTQLSLGQTLVKSSWPQKYKLKARDKELGKINASFSAIRSLRNIKADLGLGQKKVKLEVRLDPKSRSFWEENIAWIERLTLSTAIIFKKELKRVLYEQEGLAFNLDIESADLSIFLASLSKKISSLDSVLKKVDQKLKNKKFLEKAAPDIVNKEKKKSEDISANLKRLKELKDAFK